MTQSTRIECPHCSTKLNVKNPAVLGKKVRCPKCEEPFLAEAPRDEWEQDFAEGPTTIDDGFGETLPTNRTLPAAALPAKRPRKPSAAKANATAEESAPKQRKARSRRTDQETMPVFLWPVCGLAGGLVAGLIWVAVGYYFQREVGYIAWAVGLCVGLGVRIAAGERSGFGAGLMAIAVSIFVILACKFTVAYLWTAHFVDQMAVAAGEVSDDVAKRLLAMEVAQAQGAKPAAVGGKPPVEDLSDADNLEDFPKEVRAETERRWQKMSAKERGRLKAGLQVVQKAPPAFLAVFTFLASFRALDILWFGLASFTAFRVASRD
jgi:predicted Zn finger-like uncharacterized protein